MSTHQIKTPAVTQNPPTAAAASFHGVLRYHDSSRWGRAITLALAQWNAAHIGVTFKPSTDADGADVLIVSDQSTLNRVRTAMASRVGIQPGEPVTITLGNRPRSPHPARTCGWSSTNSGMCSGSATPGHRAP